MLFRSPQNLVPSREGAQNILKQFSNVSQNVDDFVDTSLLDALKSNGVFAVLQQKYGAGKNP